MLAVAPIALTQPHYDTLQKYEKYREWARKERKKTIGRLNKRRVNQQVQNYKTCLKNSYFGVEKFNFSLGLSFNFFCIEIILLFV